MFDGDAENCAQFCLFVRWSSLDDSYGLLSYGLACIQSSFYAHTSSEYWIVWEVELEDGKLRKVHANGRFELFLHLFENRKYTCIAQCPWMIRNDSLYHIVTSNKLIVKFIFKKNAVLTSHYDLLYLITLI